MEEKNKVKKREKKKGKMKNKYFVFTGSEVFFSQRKFASFFRRLYLFWLKKQTETLIFLLRKIMKS
jgi:hypothetical protein